MKDREDIAVLARPRTVWVWWAIDLIGVAGAAWLASWLLGLSTTESLIAGFGSIGLWNLNAMRLEVLRVAAALVAATKLAAPPSRFNPRDN